LSNTEKTALVEVPNDEVLDTETEENAGLTKALETYRKLIDRKDLVEPLTEKEQEKLEKKIKEIEERDVIEEIVEHEPVEIPCEKNKCFQMMAKMQHHLF
jgi:DNA-directed RNA polymerase I, II, and III subunit RPABC2